MKQNASSRRKTPVHPHVCGEHAIGLTLSRSPWRFIPTCVGNIPLDNIQAHLQPRFIPTCVGNMLDKVLTLRENPVHPHVCGEHTSRPFVKQSRTRFIPTCVGNIYAPMPTKTPMRFIPTCVGNMPITAFVPNAPTGSSPRVWGTCWHFSTQK